MVLLASHIDRVLSLPASDFFLDVLRYYKVQPHNLPPNSMTELSAFVSLCEGFLGIKPSLILFWYFFSTRKNSISASVPCITSTLSLILRKDRVYPRVHASESVK